MIRRSMRAASALAILTSACLAQPDSAALLPPLLEPRMDPPLAFEDPEVACVECHETHVEQWRISNHAYAMKDPVFHAMVRLGQAQSNGKLGQFCVQCHSPIGLATGQTTVYFDEDANVFAQRTEDLDTLAMRGVSCDVCHSITNVVEPQNARMVLTPDGTRRGTIADPVPSSAHQSAYSEVHATSNVCSSCHAVISPKKAAIEETFPEWQQSSFARRGVQCQGCHMPEYRGRAAPDGPERTLHEHYFVGVDVSLLPPDEFPGYTELRERAAALLREAARFELTTDGDGRSVEISIENLAGHALPSGATAERQLWVELLVRDERGDVVFESGTLDPNDDIRDGVESHSSMPGTDPQLVYYGQALIDVPGLTGAPDAERPDRLAAVEQACLPIGLGAVTADSGIEVVSFPWAANWQCNYMIPADGTDRRRYTLEDLDAGEYTVSARLLFRTFGPYFLRELEHLAGLDPAVKTRVPTVVMAEASASMTIPCLEVPCGGGAAPTVGDLVINELLIDPWDPSSPTSGDANGDGAVSSGDDEFVELVNVSTASVNLAGCEIHDGTRLRHRFEVAALAPKTGAVVFGGGTPTGAFGGSVVAIASSGALGLNNGGDDVTVRCPGPGGGLTEVAQVAYGSEGGDNESLTRATDGDGATPMVKHSTVDPRRERYSPGLCSDGAAFSERL